MPTIVWTFVQTLTSSLRRLPSSGLTSQVQTPSRRPHVIIMEITVSSSSSRSGREPMVWHQTYSQCSSPMVLGVTIHWLQTSRTLREASLHLVMSRKPSHACSPTSPLSRTSVSSPRDLSPAVLSLGTTSSMRVSAVSPTNMLSRTHICSPRMAYCFVRTSSTPIQVSTFMRAATGPQPQVK